MKYDKNPMAKHYHTKNIRTLLTKGFSVSELRNFCFDTSDFQPVYDQLAQNLGKDEIISRILEYAQNRLKFEILLEWAKEEIPGRYEEHQPYYNPARILLVDDLADWREQLGGLLEDKDYEVVTARNREEAMQYIQQSSEFSLAIIDMRLDEGDEENREGIDLGIMLRKSGYKFPIFILTAHKLELEDTKKFTLHPFRFIAVEKGKIGSGGVGDLLPQIQLAIHEYLG